MDEKSPLTKYLVFIFSLTLLSCATEEDVAAWGSWHDQYVEDSCARCEECCTATTEEGFIDPYGIERPASWLPEADGGIE